MEQHEKKHWGRGAIFVAVSYFGIITGKMHTIITTLNLGIVS